MSLIPFDSVPIRENGEPLVDVEQFGLLAEPVYFSRELSSDRRVPLRRGVVERLVAVQSKLGGRKLKIWDGFRPRPVQKLLFDEFHSRLVAEHPEWTEERLRQEAGMFVVDPGVSGRIPPHATGGAVDLTIVDASGQELDMGTGFDHFGPEAAPHYFETENASATVRDNRRLLRETLEAAGFRSHEHEWWHFDYGTQLWAAGLNQPFAVYGETHP